MHDLGVGGIKIDLFVNHPDHPFSISSPSTKPQIVDEVTTTVLDTRVTAPIAITVYGSPSATFHLAERGFLALVYAETIEDVKVGARILETATVCEVAS